MASGEYRAPCPSSDAWFSTRVSNIVVRSSLSTLGEKFWRPQEGRGQSRYTRWQPDTGRRQERAAEAFAQILPLLLTFAPARLTASRTRFLTAARIARTRGGRRATSAAIARWRCISPRLIRSRSVRVDPSAARWTARRSPIERTARRTFRQLD